MSDSQRALRRAVILGALLPAVLILVAFAIGLVLALGEQVELTLARVTLIRDALLVVLMLQGLALIVVLAILIWQVARLALLLREEALPILRSLQEATRSAQDTVDFVSHQVVTPVRRLYSLMNTAIMLRGELRALLRIVRRAPPGRQERAASGHGD